MTTENTLNNFVNELADNSGVTAKKVCGFKNVPSITTMFRSVNLFNLQHGLHHKDHSPHKFAMAMDFQKNGAIFHIKNVEEITMEDVSQLSDCLKKNGSKSPVIRENKKTKTITIKI